jgi:hypothetical protein
MRGAIFPLPQFLIAWCLSSGYNFKELYLVRHKDNFAFVPLILEAETYLLLTYSMVQDII